jgi:alpha-D-ribose 1-methylphosphonate 5-triphosphate synthase subunit PhnH
MRPGFADPVRESQRAFRVVLDAVAHPGRIVELSDGMDPPPTLHPATAAVALTLVDFETPLWVDHAVGAEARHWLRFHTGAPIVERPTDAAFAVVADAARVPPLDAFPRGTDERPERSATLIVQVDDLVSDEGCHARDAYRLTGPGIAVQRRLHVPGLPDAFRAALRANHAEFPRGVDVLLTAGTRLAALPRTTCVEM